MTNAATLAQLGQFDTIIDVRTPAEFAEDHIPGAINLPVLDNDERVRVGTLYKQESAFAAKKVGAALVARNIARHLDSYCADKPKDWRPLIYCWRGGNRSGSMAHILARVGWKSGQLDGGYRAYRRAVLDALQTLPAQFRYRALCGATGTGKSRLLQALQAQGAQVLDLEGLAVHRGSVLGNLPGAAQPSQKLFESRVWQALCQLDPQRIVHVEAESKKIGQVRAPDALLENLWQGDCVLVEAGVPERVALLKQEYAHFLQDPEALCAKLEFLTGIHGRETVEAWQAAARAGDWDDLVADLLVRHYDPSYRKATLKHYPQLPQALVLQGGGLQPADFTRMATELLQSAEAPA